MPAGPRSEESQRVLSAMEAGELSHQTMADAIVQTVAYSDVFDYPLTLEEIHRYLVGVAATVEQVQQVLTNGLMLATRLTCSDGYFYLSGRAGLVEKRLQRAQVPAALWPKAIHYGHVIARMPFVRMVAITGALSMNNSDPGDDLDYFVITEPGRLWLCRAFIIALVRSAARRGDIICPNYFVSTRALLVTEHNLYTAHEMAQMIPVAGVGLYHRMREMNSWVREYLPNAGGAPKEGPVSAAGPRFVWAVAEALLRTPPGTWLERWEMDRKVRKLESQMPASDPVEAEFGVDWCKGHFGGYGRRTLGAMADRMSGAGGRVSKGSVL
jgi:hypothetical protein